MANGILVYGEIRDGGFNKGNRELVSAAKQLSEAGGGGISMVLIGESIDAALKDATASGVENLYVVRDPVLSTYSSQGFALAMQAAIAACDPKVVLFPTTAMGRDLSARTAARCGASLFTDCTEVGLSDGNLHVKRPVYSGKVYVEVVSSAALQMASIRPNIFPAAAADGSAVVNDVTVSIDDSEIGGRVTEVVGTSGDKKDLTGAEIVVSGGRSLKSGENFKILEDLAEVLHAAVGASRAAVDAGYVPHSMQVGQTGKVVNPKLYIACGISGAIQHLVGMRTSKVIVAINKDGNAPIFQKADYGIVGDLFELVPLLTGEFKALLG